MSEIFKIFIRLPLDIQRLIVLHLSVEEHELLCSHPLLANKPISNDNDVLWMERIQETFGLKFETRKDIYKLLKSHMRIIGEAEFYLTHGVYYKYISSIYLNNRNSHVKKILNNLDLLRGNINVQNQDGWTLLFYAVLYEPEAVDSLLRAKINVNIQESRGTTALMLAITHNASDKIIEELIKVSNLDLQNDCSGTALMLAIEKFRFRIAKKLILSGANPNLRNRGGWAALPLLTHYSQERYKIIISEDSRIKYIKKINKILSTLIKAGADVNIRNIDGNTTLKNMLTKIDSAEILTIETAKILIEAGADIEAINHQGWSILMCVVRNANSEFSRKAAKFLIENNANINFKNREGITSLMFAANNSRLDSSEKMVRTLIDAKANLDEQDSKGWTALMFAADRSNITSTEETVRMLIEAGANLDLKNEDGLTACMIAKNSSSSTERTINLLETKNLPNNNYKIVRRRKRKAKK